MKDYRSHADLGRWRAYEAPLGWGGFTFTAISAMLITLAVGLAVWHLGRSYGRTEELALPVEAQP